MDAGEHHYTGRGRETVQSWLNNHVLPTFRDKRMCDIRLSTIKEWWAGMRAKRYRGKLYSASMLESVYTTFGSILRSAVTDKVIPVHPMDGWDPDLPKRDKSVRDIWEHDRVDTVIQALPDRYRGVAVVSATCGHRQGESFAVALEDVNRFRKEITIRHQVLRIDGKTVLTPPKNNAVRWCRWRQPPCTRSTRTLSSTAPPVSGAPAAVKTGTWSSPTTTAS